MSEKTKKIGCFQKVLAFPGLCGLLVAGLWWFQLRSVPLEISPKTTILTEPLTSDGRCVDYVKCLYSLYPPETKTDRNAAFRILRLIGVPEKDPPTAHAFRYYGIEKKGLPDEETARREYVAQHYAVLGLTPCEPEFPTELAMPSMDYEKFLKRKFPNHAEDEVQEAALKAAHERFVMTCVGSGEEAAFDPEFTRAWLEENSPMLDAVSRAISESEICCFPFLTERVPELKVNPQLLLIRDLAQRILFRAACRIQTGDLEGALADQAVCCRFAKMIQRHSLFLTEFLVASAVEQSAHSLPFGRNPDAQPSAEQWNRFLTASGEPLTPRETQKARVREMLEGPVLFLALAGWQEAMNGNWGCEEDSSPWLRHCGWDWNVVFRTFLQTFREDLKRDLFQPAVTGDSQPVSPLVDEKVRLLLRTRADRSEKLGQAYRLGKSYEFALRKPSVDQLLKIGVAFQLFRQEHDGKLPPAFTLSEPKDGESAKPLHSWRVLLLPYLGETELFAKIHLNEPWDSEWNSQFHAQCPAIFQFEPLEFETSGAFGSRQASSALTPVPAPGETNCSVILGDETLFNSSGTGINTADLSAGQPEREIQRMVLVTVRAQPVNWMKPDGELTAEELLRSGNELHFSENPDEEMTESANAAQGEGLRGSIPVFFLDGSQEVLFTEQTDAQDLRNHLFGTPVPWEP